MANMSYCRFQNTLSALQDCARAMHDDLSADEHAARTALIALCAKLGETEINENVVPSMKYRDHTITATDAGFEVREQGDSGVLWIGPTINECKAAIDEVMDDGRGIDDSVV